MGNTKMKITKENIIGLILFALAILAKGIGDSIFVTNNPNSPFNYVKYIILLVFIFYFILKSKGKPKNVFKEEYKSLIICYIGIGIISLFASLFAYKFTFRTIKEFIFILTPIFFSYCALNYFKKEEITAIAKFAVLVYIISYFIEIGSSFSISTAIKAITHFSLLGGQDSFLYDSLESSAFPDAMMALFVYFAYFNKNNKKWLWISFIGILLMNKRLIIVFAILIMILIHVPFLKDFIKKQTPPKKLYIVLFIIFMFSPLLVIQLTKPSVESWVLNKFDFNMPDFWMGRDSMVQYFLANNFVSYGLGSTYDFRNHLLEIESIKFLFETSIVGCAILSFTYWKIVKKNWYLIIVMLYIFLNINTSTSIITGAFAWIYYLILIGMVNKNGKEESC